MIYAIHHLPTGRVYVGDSIHPDKRWADHQSELRLGKHRNALLQHAWNADGRRAFEFILLDERGGGEAEWMQRFAAREPATGFNLKSAPGERLPWNMTGKTCTVPPSLHISL